MSSSDNTVTPALGNDVIVLGTTVGTDLMTSSNEVVVDSGSFGVNTIVDFAASGWHRCVQSSRHLAAGGTTALNSLSADKSIVIQAQAATPATTTNIARVVHRLRHCTQLCARRLRQHTSGALHYR